MRDLQYVWYWITVCISMAPFFKLFSAQVTIWLNIIFPNLSTLNQTFCLWLLVSRPRWLLCNTYILLGCLTNTFVTSLYLKSGNEMVYFVETVWCWCPRYTPLLSTTPLYTGDNMLHKEQCSIQYTMRSSYCIMSLLWYYTIDYPLFHLSMYIGIYMSYVQTQIRIWKQEFSFSQTLRSETH